MTERTGITREQISVEQLRVGMFVAELDRPWLDTSFAFQGFLLTSQALIDALRRQCKFVFIDLERSDPHIVGKRSLSPASVRGHADYPERASVEQELPFAAVVYNECEQILHATLQALKSGGQLDAEQLKGAVSKVADSIVRNQDAVLLLIKLRQKAVYELKRALEVSVLMITFGRFLQLAREELDLLGVLGLLQDIGKVRIPDTILGKQGPLSPEETTIAEEHVKHSAHIVRNAAGLPQGLDELVLLHHERYDGSGYPHGLAGSSIGLYGSMAALVDTYSALTTDRPHSEQISPSNALGLLYKQRGVLFHEPLVEQFIQCIGIYPVGSVVELNTGEIGIVIAQNRVRRLQPRVMVVLDANWKPITPQKMLDLRKDPKASGDEPYRIRRTLESNKLPLDPRDFFL